MSEHRGHKQHEIEHIRDMVDRISNLPDCILHHILSFMSTKEFVKTSILSTRWKNLWAFVPNIDFDDDLLCDREDDGRHLPDVASFVNFVERVLRLRNPSSNMEKFRLSCRARVFRDASKIHSWISYAIMHNVKELDLTLWGMDPSVIPQSMFDSTSLVSLEIRSNCAIELPSHVSFPCLKTLHLTSVPFQYDDFIEKLLSGCPVLEELILFGNHLRHLNNILISSSTLKSLIIRDVSRFEEFNDLCSGCKISVDAANLTYFEYNGFLLNQIFFTNTPSLDKSFVDIPNPGVGVYEVGCRDRDLIKQLQCVVSLRLSNNTLEVIGLLIYLVNGIYASFYQP